MKQAKALLDRIFNNVHIHLRKFDLDLDSLAKNVMPMEQLARKVGYYGLTTEHPIHFTFLQSSLAGSYFLGQTEVRQSIVYKSDVRGDELKEKGAVMKAGARQVVLAADERIAILKSFLYKTLVHNFSHDPETPDLFYIRYTIANAYANIHGAPLNGCYLGPFATVDLTTCYNCAFGAYSYVQTGTLAHTEVPAGKIWVKGDQFEFTYQHDMEELKPYIEEIPGSAPAGRFMEYDDARDEKFQAVYNMVHMEPPKNLPRGASINRYSYFCGDSRVEENVLVSQRAYVDSSFLGKGANAQENTQIINSTLSGMDVTAHGAAIICSHLETNVFVGFNSFLMGTPECGITLRKGVIVLPHTIIDPTEPVTVPEDTIIWGLIRTQKDLEEKSIAAADLEKVTDTVTAGAMTFSGSGKALVEAFRHRIEHILEVNGAFYDGKEGKGHAQTEEYISFNIIQPYPEGPLEGLFPSMNINP